MACTNSETRVIEIEHRYWQAIEDKDVDAVPSMTDDPCILTGAQGVSEIDHKTFEHMMRPAPWTIDVFAFAEDVAVVVAYSVHEGLTVEGFQSIWGGDTACRTRG